MTNKTKQTAVEWLIGKIYMTDLETYNFMKENGDFEQAKKMELKQRIDDYNNGHIDRGRNIFNEPKQINNEQTI